jgi:hypothetical protein
MRRDKPPHGDFRGEQKPLAVWLTVGSLLILGIPLLTGCNLFCGGPPCPKGQYRDSFCGCSDEIAPSKSGAPLANQKPYYMTARYSCVEVADPSSSRGSCDIQQYADSCQLAKSAILQTVASRGDICQHCSPPNIDHTRRWDGNPPQWIQGGPCMGESSIRPPSTNLVAEIRPPFLTIGSDTSGASPYPTSSATPKPLTLVAFVPSPTAPLTSCIQQCPKDHSNPDCSLSTIQKNYEQPLSTLYARVVKKTDDVITTQDLQQLFGADTSQCKRDSTTVSKDGIQNTGDKCNIHADLGKTNVGLDIDIPQVLKANFEPSSSVLKLSFPDAANGPSVAFHRIDKPTEEHPLNDDFGGQVLWLESDGTVLFLRTQKGCIGARY